MDIKSLQRAIVDGLEDVKGQHIVVFDTEALSPLFERVIVASGTSNRQTKALAASVRDRVKAAGFGVLSVEGEDTGEWVIVDCGAAVVHIMQPAIREYYRLEELWGATPLPLRGAARAKKAAPTQAPAKKAVGQKATAKKVPPPKAPAKKTPAKKAPSQKAPAQKAAAPKPRAPKVTAKRASAPKAAPRKAPAKKAASSSRG
jgi:ribosome-associated protein